MASRNIDHRPDGHLRFWHRQPDAATPGSFRKSAKDPGQFAPLVLTPLGTVEGGMVMWIILAVSVIAYALPYGVPEQSPSAVRPQLDVALAESLETKLKRVAAAANSVTPKSINSTTELFKVSSYRNILIYYIRDLNFVLPEEMEKSKVDTFVKKLAPTIQKLVAEEACTEKVNLFLLNEGVIIRYDVHDKQKIKYMEIAVRKSDCQ